MLSSIKTQLLSYMLCSFLSNNCMQDAVLLTAITGFTSVYAATVTYTIIGYRATDKFDTCISKWVWTAIVFLKDNHQFGEDTLPQNISKPRWQTEGTEEVRVRAAKGRTSLRSVYWTGSLAQTLWHCFPLEGHLRAFYCILSTRWASSGVKYHILSTGRDTKRGNHHVLSTLRLS